MELKKIGVLSLGKIAGLFGVIYGLLSGILLSIIYSNSELLATVGQQLPSLISTLGYKSLIAMPILNGIIYFLAGIVLALIYNLLAGWIGGIKIELKK